MATMLMEIEERDLGWGLIDVLREDIRGLQWFKPETVRVCIDVEHEEKFTEYGFKKMEGS